jgi:hypothetical protein
VTFAVCLLAVLAGNAITGGLFIWAVYSVLHKRIEDERKAAVELVRIELDAAQAVIRDAVRESPAGTYVSRGGEA